MYWVIGTFIIVAMLGVLTVAGETPMPLLESISLLESSDSLFLPLLLIIISLILVIFKLRTALTFPPTRPLAIPIIEPNLASPTEFSTSTAASSLSLSTTANPLEKSLPLTSSQRFLRNSFYNRRSLFKTLRYLIIALLALALLVGSMWQAVTKHQLLELTKITTSTRVQAWVTIEGISDSVYDATNSSGYRQVATLSEIRPLTTELSAEELAAQSHERSRENASDPLPISKQSNERRVLLSLYPKKENDDPSIIALNSLQPGARVLMTLSLAPLTSSEQTLNNPTGFDSYRWLRARHIDGVATIIEISSATDHTLNSSLANDSATSYWQRLRMTTIDNWRLQLRQHFYQDWSAKTATEQQAQAVTLSLLTGDRSLINRETKDLYQLAGISHLLAISGTHVLFMAIMLAAMAVLVVERFYPALYRSLPRWQVRWLVMIGSAFIYALFTGFDVPAARTAWMLLAIGLVRLTLMPVSTLQVLLALAILMAWIDPYVLWQAGYWLSFIAVALLLKYEDALSNQSSSSISGRSASATSTTLKLEQQPLTRADALVNSSWLGFKRLFKLQFWLFITLLPITLLLFGKVSLWGLLINLFAIGLFGWLIVPLNLLAGLCYLLSPTIADSIWRLVSNIVSHLHQLIEWLTTLPVLKSAWLYTPINFAMLLMAALVILPWLLPRGLLSRLLALPPLMLLLMTIYVNQQSFSQQPTLYILPTGDRYLTAALLLYPMDDKDARSHKASQKISISDTASWLFLADHRLQNEETRPSSLTAEKLAKLLEQQLRTLAINNLQGVIVQSSVPTLTATLANTDKANTTQSSSQNQPLLAQTVAQLSQALPTAQYWQAGRHELWGILKQEPQKGQSSLTNKPLISAQDCIQGKQWQHLSGQLKLQALTGWSEIDDTSVWDCSVAIVSQSPITVVHYNASNPQRPIKANVQTLVNDKTWSVASESVSTEGKTDSTMQPAISSRLILDTATHKRSWQLWALLCRAEPLALAISHAGVGATAWLSHSSSAVSSEILMAQQTDQLMTYDEQPLDAALMLTAED